MAGRSAWARWMGPLAVLALLASCAVERPRQPGPLPPVGSPSFPGGTGAPPALPPIAAAPQGIDRLYAALDRLRAAPGPDDKLRVLLLGDSHVAGGIITQRLRERFQRDFGDAGRGPMVPGLPYAGRREADWKLTQAGDWTYENSLRPNATGPFGLSGFLARSRSAGATLSLMATAAAGFDEVEISFLRRAGGGALEIFADDRLLARLDTQGAATMPDRTVLPAPPGSRKLALRAVDRRPVELLALGVEKRARGVIVEGHGVSGATAWLMTKWDQSLLSEDLRRRDPALILLAFGTNEGFQPNFDAARYSADYAQLIRLIQDAAPRAALVLVGPPDAARKGRSPSVARGCDWTTPANLFAARAAQQQLAASLGVMFWDWSGLMNGPCGVHDWVAASPPLARPDHVHLTQAGYTASADSLYQDLVGPYLTARQIAARP